MDPRHTRHSPPSPADLGRRDLLARTAGITAGATLLGTLTPTPASATTPHTTSHPIRTQSGLVTGVPAALPGVTVHKGIPYASSTASENRWRARNHRRPGRASARPTPGAPPAPSRSRA